MAGGAAPANLATGMVLVFAHTNSFRPSEAQYSASHVVRLPVASGDTKKLIAEGAECEIWGSAEDPANDGMKVAEPLATSVCA